MDQSWCAPCAARAEPCQAAVWEGQNALFERQRCFLCPAPSQKRRRRGVGDNFCLLFVHNKIETRNTNCHTEEQTSFPGEHRRVTSRTLLLQKLSEVLADVLTAGPLAHAVAVQGVGASTFFM